MTHIEELIVLGSTKVGDSSLVFHTLSRSFGRRSFIVSVGRSGSGMTMFLPLNILQAEIVENPKSDLWRAKSIVVIDPLLGIRSSVRKNAISMFLSEVLFRVLKDGSNEEGLFEWVRNRILALDGMEGDFSNFHISFLLEFASALGFAASSVDLLPFAESHYDTLNKFNSSTFAESMLIPLSGADRNEIADILLRYISYHAESAINVKSLSVLRELFS